MQVGPSLWRVLFPDAKDRVNGASTAAKSAGKEGVSLWNVLSESQGAESPVSASLWEQLAPSAVKPADILARYDLTDITPREFSQMLEELHQSGLLTDDQFRELNEIRKDLASADVLPQEKIDLLDFYRRLLQRAERLGTDDAQGDTASRIDDWRRRLAWLEKLASAQNEIVAAQADSDSVLAVDAWA
ncbi:hypothetical protein [Thermopirellula anaerolimosa]